MLKIKSGVRRVVSAVSLGVAAALVAPVSFAQAAGGPDYTALTTGVDFTSTIAAVLAVAALLVGLWLAVRGAKIVIGMVRGG
ncbi:hypothetical protein PQQ52_11475 [Paraburkholderia sediminicola]|uniref:hypothetical protein n=1 Tax=Paraburkholderia sediminicola TaxID=458836 RepID=UPI0038BB53C5